MKNQRTHRKQFGATIMELMVTVALTAFIVAIVIPSMIFIARAMKGFRTDMNYQQQLTDFYQRVSLERSRSYEIAINTLGQVEMTGYTSTFEEDEESTTGFTYVQNTVVSRLIYFDVDGEPDTIEDNTLEMVTVESNKAGNVVRTSTKTLLTDVSPLLADRDEDGTMEVLPLFETISTDGRTVVQINLRVGDRTWPSQSQWDKRTGPGYQGYVLQYILIPQVR